MSKRLLNRLLSNIEANQYELDDPRTTLLRRDIILSKPFLKKVYEEWYALIKKRLSDIPEGTMILIVLNRKSSMNLLLRCCMR